MKKAARNLVLLVAMAATIGCDRATKHLAGVHLAGWPQRTYLGGAVRLAYVRNAGGFLGMGADLPARPRTVAITIGTGVLLFVLGIGLWRGGWGRAEAVGLGLVWAGGASNLADRLLQGSVPDFMNVGIGPLRTGIFNVADLAITLGVLLCLWHGPWRTRRPPSPVQSG